MKILIGLLVAGAVIALGLFIVRGLRETMATASAIHDGVIKPYLEFLKQEQFEQAYEACLSDGLKQQVPREAFVAAHRARVAEHGQLEGWRDTTISHEAGVTEDVTLVGLRYVLSYERRDVHVLYLSDADQQPYKLVRLLGSEGGSRTLGPGIW